MLASLFLIQAAVPQETPLPTVVPQCRAASSDEIIVCGSRDASRKYRLDRLPPAKSGLGKAETTIGGANVAAVAEQGEIGGIPTNRAMIRLKIKF